MEAMSTATLTKSMIAIFQRDRLICVTEENSDAHQEYIAANEAAMREQIEEWRKPFDDHGLLFFNVGEEIARESGYDLVTYIKFVAGPGFYRESYLEGGLKALREAMKYQCLMDYYRASVGYNLFKQSEYADQGREGYLKFTEQLTDEDIYRAIYCKTQKYRFETVAAR
jgi:hypothetical protein